MEELHQCAVDEIRVEDMKQSYRKELQEAKTDKTEGKRGGTSGAVRVHPNFETAPGAPSSNSIHS